MKRSRALFALVTLVVACAPFIALVHETTPVHAATSSSTGTPGAFSVRDTSVNPGAQCDHLVADNVYQVTPDRMFEAKPVWKRVVEDSI